MATIDVTPQAEVDGKRVFVVTVTRTSEAVFHVLADDEDAAHDDARELATELSGADWDDVDDDIWTRPATSLPTHGWYWTGGPDGEQKRWRNR